MRVKPYDLYFWPTPNGRKITIFMEEAQLPYNVIPVNIRKGDQHKPDYLRISPNNKMPALVDYDGPAGEKLSVFESGAILQYLGRKHGAFYPITSRPRVAVDQWLHFQMASIGPYSGQAYHFRDLKGKAAKPYGVKRFTDEVARLYKVMDKQLGKHDFIAGEYSIADMAIYPWIMPERLGQDMTQFPHLEKWMERMAARPAVERGMSVIVES